MDEKELIALCRRGDLKAFETLIGAYQPCAQALANRMLGDRDEALDAVQDSFTQAYFNLHAYDVQRSFRAWLLGITCKRCLDRLRRRKSFITFLRQYAGFIRLRDREKVNQTADRLQVSLGRLHDKERAVVLLRLKEGLSINEIAVVLGCSASTVRVHLFNARRKLKKEVECHVQIL